jgi:hypothetical protein
VTVLTPADGSVSEETLLDVPSSQDEFVDAQLPENVRADDDMSTTTTWKPALAVGVLVTALPLSVRVTVPPPVVVLVGEFAVVPAFVVVIVLVVAP